MVVKTQDLINFFKAGDGIARFSSIIKAGFYSDVLSNLLKQGDIEKIGKGLYRLVDYVPDTHPDLVTASFQTPRGVVCLISALAFHEVTLQIPKYVDMAIPRGTRPNRIKYPPVRFYQFSKKAWESGIEEQIIGGHKIKVYNLAKTIADCFKFRNKIGIDIARDALKTSISEKKVKPNDIIVYARICRVDNILKPILELML
ncbi:MAG: type IV toxin-antitoxin system AbiEi family antitoxin domain-containing protein [Endomicrobiales bacterium]|jgi:predicted transcriptional regulator of viral defense system